MRFESRELKPFAEPITNDELKEGSIYYFLHYLGDNMFVPKIGTVVFIGRNLEPDDAERVYFQDLESYQQGNRYELAPDFPGPQARFYVGSERELNHVFDFEHALEELMRCALGRKSMSDRL